MDYLLASVAVLSAIGAVISAWLAYQSNLGAARKDRESRVRELSLIANKVVAATIRVDDLANQLKTGYRTLFTLAAQGPGSSRLKLYTDGIENKQGSLGPMQTAARETLENGVDKLSEEQINELREKLGRDFEKSTGISHTLTGCGRSSTSILCPSSRGMRATARIVLQDWARQPRLSVCDLSPVIRSMRAEDFLVILTRRRASDEAQAIYGRADYFDPQGASVAAPYVSALEAAVAVSRMIALTSSCE